MPRFISPVTDIKPLGYIQFFDSNSNAPKITYKDELESIPNSLQIDVDANGNLPNIFFSGSASVIYVDQFDQQYYARNPVGEEIGVGNFTAWSNVISYDLNDIVIGSDSEFYKSLANANQGNDPTTSEVNWEQIRFIGVWNTNIIYAIGEIVQTTDGNLWKALTATSGNDPSVDSGTNWAPAIDKANVLSDTNTVIPQTVSGALTVLRVNELRDGGSFTIPLANTVNVNQTITISQPDEFVSFEPVITASGSDTITDSVGTDTSITFDNTQSVEITLTSDGVNDWGL